LGLDVGPFGLPAGAEGPHPEVSTQLQERGAGTPTRALNQDGIAALGRCGSGQHLVGSHVVQHQAHGGRRRDLRWNGNDPRGGNDGVFGPATNDREGGHALPNLDVPDPRTHGFDYAHHIPARYQWCPTTPGKVPLRVQVLADQQVGEADPGRLHPYANLLRSWRRYLPRAHLQRLRASIPGRDDRCTRQWSRLLCDRGSGDDPYRVVLGSRLFEHGHHLITAASNGSLHRRSPQRHARPTGLLC
jgi:hypothetical protein